MTSKLRESLLRTISPNRKSDSEAVKVDAANEAFEQADTKNTEAGLGANIESIDSLRAEPKQEWPQPLNRPRMDQPKASKLGMALSGVALVIAIGAMGVAGIAIVNQQHGSSSLEQELDSLSGSVSELNQSVVGMAADIAQNKLDAVAGTDALATEMQAMHIVVAGHGAVLEAVKSEQDKLTNDLTAQSSLITENEQVVSKLGERVGGVEKKLASINAAAKKKRAAARRIQSDPTSIQGAQVASIDSWGGRTNVMLREPTGNWVPLTVGDFYKGWTLKGAIGDEAVFQNGSKVKQVKVKE